MTSSYFIWAVLSLQAAAGIYCLYEREFPAIAVMAAGVLAQVSALMTLGRV